MTKLVKELFGFERPESKGERLHFKAYEVFLLGYTLYFGWEWGLYIQGIEAVVQPLGIATHVDISVMFHNQLSVLNAVVMTIAAVMGLLRIFPRAAYTVLLLAFHVQYVARYSLGEICHDSHFVGTGIMAIMVAMWLYEDAAKRRRFAFGASFFFIGLGYTSAAVCKLVGTGLHWVDGRHMWLWIGEKSVDAYSKFGVYDLNALQELALSSRVVASLILVSGVLTELVGFLFWFRRYRPYMALACAGLHLGIFFVMNILFDMIIYQLLVLALPWGTWFDRMESWWARPLGKQLNRFALRFA